MTFTIISGAQTGVDRAALDVAIELGLPYGGWVPKGAPCEDNADLLALYPSLKERAESDYPSRTRANVEDSTATLIVCKGRLEDSGRGTQLTSNHAAYRHKPYMVANGYDDVAAVMRWLNALVLMHGDVVLNVAGPRGSGWPDGYFATHSLLTAVLSKWAQAA